MKAHLRLNVLLWGVYVALLGVLTPHTAWAFRQFEPPGYSWLGWVAAFAFEAAIFGLTVRLKGRLETTPRYTSGNVAWRRFAYRYLNSFASMLLLALAVSVAANWAHAVEFGQAFAVFARYSLSPLAYSVMFGGILPITSLVFAQVLADSPLTEAGRDEELAEAKRGRREAERELKLAKEDSVALSLRLAEAEDIVRILAADKVRDRILAVHARWPELAAGAVSIIADASPSYTSEVLAARGEELGVAAYSSE